MAPCLPTSASICLACQYVPAFPYSIVWQNPQAIRRRCATYLFCVLLLPLTLCSSARAISGILGGVRAICFLSEFVGIICRWLGLGPRLNPTFLSFSPVFLVEGHTHVSLLCNVFGLEWGFLKGCGSLVLPVGMSFTLDFNCILSKDFFVSQTNLFVWYPLQRSL